VLLDREEGGGEHLQKEGVRLHSVTKISSVARKLLDMDAITRTQFDELTGKETETEGAFNQSLYPRLKAKIANGDCPSSTRAAGHTTHAKERAESSHPRNPEFPGCRMLD